jgi:ABC-type branched-subunit amino acid transport system ATPase component/branched-subunit amino acid ABC-type transport system permease component
MTVLGFALLGLGTGAIYALIAQGQVLIYQGSGILNFAQGAFLMVGAYTYYELHALDGWPFAPALVVTMLCCGVVGAAVHLLILRPMKRSSALTRVVATLGVMVVIQSIGILIYQQNLLEVASSLPTTTVDVLPGIPIGIDQVIIFGIGAALTAVLAAVYRYTNFGRVTRAVAENPLAASATGHSPDTVAAWNWAIGSALAGLAGVLVAPITFLQVNELILLVVPALAAGLVGSFNSFSLAFAGGLAIGVVQSLVGRYVNTAGWSDAVPFLLIIAVLVIRGRGIPLRSYVMERLPPVGNGRIRTAPIAGFFVVAAVLVFILPFQWSNALIVTLVLGIICLSVVVITGYAGQLSLAQYVIAGFGALIAARLSANWHFPFLAAVLGGMVAAAALGAVVALPSLRTRGINLAIVTLGLSSVIFDLVLNNQSYGGGAVGITVSSPSIFGWSIDPTTHIGRYGLVVVVAICLIGIAVANIRRGASGRRLLAVRSNERAAAAAGVSVYAAKVYAFVLASAIAALGGILFAFLQSSILSNQFDVLSSISFVTVTVVGGVGSIAGAFLGATLIAGGVVTQIFSNLQNISSWLPLVGGVALLLVLRAQPGGLAEMNRQSALLARNWLRQARRRPAHPTGTAPASTVAGRGDVAPPTVQAKTLRVEHLSVRFGGITALDDVSLELVPGQILGLIGPNGAGKTTLIDAITGFEKPAAGDIILDDIQITGWSVQRRARRGIARSFQALELFNDLSVRENLAVACDSRSALRYAADVVNPGAITLSPTADAAIGQVELESFLDERPEVLPFGKRRLVAIARALAAGPSVLLLDEPAAGLDDREASELATLVRSLSREWGMAVLLVEHNLDLVMQVSDKIMVLASGRELVSGLPEEIRVHPAVLEAYVGVPPGDSPDASPALTRPGGSDTPPMLS